MSHSISGTNNSIVLEARALTRRFGGLVAVNNVSFSVKKHEIFGLIGPNGAGKTTLFNLITAFIPPSSGKLIYQGAEVSQLRPSSNCGFRYRAYLPKYPLVRRIIGIRKCDNCPTFTYQK
ncbi:hypothetical protein NSTCB13_02223 [Nostoc sp. DSM 114160]